MLAIIITKEERGEIKCLLEKGLVVELLMFDCLVWGSMEGDRYFLLVTWIEPETLTSTIMEGCLD